MEKLGLQGLLAPKSVAEFLRDDFQKRPFVIKGRDAAVYAGMPTLDQIEHSIDTLETNTHECRLVGGDDPAKRRFIDRKGELRDVLVDYGRGSSINMKVERRFTAVTELRRELRRDFAAHGITLSEHGESVVFITPPNSQALPPHVDPDDLFVLQLEGRKHWNVYAWDPFWTSGDPPPPALQVDLDPGDLLYVPQHWIHAASAGAEFSYALTIGYRPAAWAEMFQGLAAKLFGVPPLHEALPAWAIENGRLSPRGQDHLLEMVRQLLDAPIAREQLARIEVKGAPRPGTLSGLAEANQVRALDGNTVCALSAPATVERLIDGVEIATAEYKVKGPVAIESALQWIAGQSREFTVADIGGTLSSTSKVTLARRLILEGVLQRRSAAAP